MKQLAVRLVMVAVLVAAMSGIGSAQADKVDLTGKWVFQVQTEAGGGTPRSR